ncbi:hypothetical protein [Deinococcus aestuarii]|uniref:hypothetical protein n=1 Tax=Deinococcus aestuarii TaxID=2774531 RepID=UPI001C0B3BAF|nr:hypothetical protein [Deinococcus aestuarii]
MTTYVSITLELLSSVPDGEAVLLTGRYARHAEGAVLAQGERRLSLMGVPFGWVPPQHAWIDIWGILLQGSRRRLLVHDARPHGAASPVPAPSAQPLIGDDLYVLARVTHVGGQQIATTADHRAYLLLGEEVDARIYGLLGRVLTLDPPTLRLAQALPLLPVVPGPPGEEA